MAISIILYLAVMTEVFISANAVDYCSGAMRCNGAIHTMCQYRSTATGVECYNSKDVGLTAAEKNIVLKKHNELRRKVASGSEKRGSPGPQPAAARMPDLTWDNELETIAQRWANQCNNDHDKCRKVEQFDVGQNIARAIALNKEPTSLEGLIEGWYEEVTAFNNALVPSYKFDKRHGHYSQMVWADTIKIGCGRVKYNHHQEKKLWNAVMLVCNYGPIGNVVGKKVYDKK